MTSGVSRISPLQRFRDGVGFSSNAVLRNVQEIANAELTPWVLRGIAGVAGAFSNRLGTIGILGLMYGRKMADQIDFAQKVVNAVFCECDVFRPKGYNNPPPIANLSSIYIPQIEKAVTLNRQ
jgi:hypothetical protein